MLAGTVVLQGAFAAHSSVLKQLGVATTEVRLAEQLADVDALVLPGGESTTISMIAQRTGLWDPLNAFVRSGRPVLGTCAGLILLAAEVLDGRSDQTSLGALDVSVRRNAFGRQLASFEMDVPVVGLDEPFHAVCIRAPAVERLGDGVEVLAEVDGHPALVRQGAMMGAIFHPELADDPRLHELFLAG